MAKIEKEVIDNLKKHYADIYFFIVYRSVERSKGLGDLFDMLEDLSKKMKNDEASYPLVWCEETHMWQPTKDLFQSVRFINKRKGH